jgi:hypothetical protein
MEMLNWIFDGQQYSLETVYGRAVIVELPGKAKAKVIGAADRMEYLAYLELKDDIGSSASPHRFDNFETAEAFLLWHELASLDSNEELSQTLQYCVDLLTRANVNSTHLLRLQIVAGTLKLPELRFKESINRHYWK